MVIEIMENLWQVGGGDLTGAGDAAVYLVRFEDRAALIDAGTGSRHAVLRDNIAECLPAGVLLEYLFLTHCHFDHTGGAAAVREEFGCKIVAHELDAAYLESGDSEVTAASWYGTRMPPLPVDIKLEGPENSTEIGNGQLTALHWPGHSPGSMVLTTQMKAKLVLFGQDVHGPIHPSLLSDMSAYQVSLQMLLDLDADFLLEGHYGVFRGRGSVREFIRSFML
ncbi:MAG: MBL fold metallo-hydrolase [Desulfobacterales bacterium]|nr:MBL fold metallo-hydrolase [Desulfobacterales bacterium]